MVGIFFTGTWKFLRKKNVQFILWHPHTDFLSLSLLLRQIIIYSEREFKGRLWFIVKENLKAHIKQLFLLLHCLIQPWYEGFWILLYHVYMLSLGGLIFSIEKQMGTWSGRDRAGRSGERGNCGWDVLCERRIYFQFLKNVCNQYENEIKKWFSSIQFWI